MHVHEVHPVSLLLLFRESRLQLNLTKEPFKCKTSQRSISMSSLRNSRIPSVRGLAPPRLDSQIVQASSFTQTLVNQRDVGHTQ